MERLRKKRIESKTTDKAVVVRNKKMTLTSITRKVMVVLLVSLMSASILNVNLKYNANTIKADNLNPVSSGGTVPIDEGYTNKIQTFNEGKEATNQYGPGYGPYTLGNVRQSTSQTSATTFAAGLPLGTIFIDQTKIGKDNTNGNGHFEVITNDPTIASGIKVIGQTNGVDVIGYDSSAAANLKKLVPGQVNILPGKLFSITFPDAAILPDGTRADVEITYSNARIWIDQRYQYYGTDASNRYLHGAVRLANGSSPTYGTTDTTLLTNTGTSAVDTVAGQYGSAYATPGDNNRYPTEGHSIDVTYRIVNKDGTLPGGTFVYAIAGINLDRDPDMGTGNNASKVLWYTNNLDSSNYFFSESMEVKKEGRASNYIYVRSMSSLPSGSDDYVSHFHPYVTQDTSGNIRFISQAYNSKNANDGSYSSGFVTLANANGFTVTAWGHGNRGVMNTNPFSSEQIWYRYTSGSGKHGKIETTNEGNPGGDLSVGTILDGGKNPYASDASTTDKSNTFVITEGKTVTYTMTPDIGYKIKKLTVNGEEVKFSNGAISKQPINRMKKGDTYTIDTADASKWSDANKYKGQGTLTYKENGTYTFTFNHATADEEIFVEWEPVTSDILAYKVWNDNDDKDGIRFHADTSNTLPKFKLQYLNGTKWEDVTDKIIMSKTSTYTLTEPVTQQVVPSGYDTTLQKYLDGTYVINNDPNKNSNDPNVEKHPYTWQYLPIYKYDSNGNYAGVMQYRIVEVDDPWHQEYHNAEYFDTQSFNLLSSKDKSIDGWAIFIDESSNINYVKKGDGLYYTVDSDGKVSLSPASHQPKEEDLSPDVDSNFWTVDRAIPYQEIHVKNSHFTTEYYVEVIKQWNDNKLLNVVTTDNVNQYARKDIKIVLHGETETEVVDLNPSDTSTTDLTKTITTTEDSNKDDVTGNEKIGNYTIYEDSLKNKYALVENDSTYVDGYYAVVNDAIDYSATVTPPADIKPVKKGDGIYKLDNYKFGVMFEDLPTHYNGKEITYTVKETDTSGNVLDGWIFTGGQLEKVKNSEDEVIGFETTMINTPDLDEVYLALPLKIVKEDVNNSEGKLQGAEFTIYKNAVSQLKADESERLKVGQDLYSKETDYIIQKDSADNDVYYEVNNGKISSSAANPQPDPADLSANGSLNGNTIYTKTTKYVIDKDTNDNKFKYYEVNGENVDTDPANPQPTKDQLTKTGKSNESSDTWTLGTDVYVKKADGKYYLVDMESGKVAQSYTELDEKLLKEAKDPKTGEVDKNVIVTDDKGVALVNFLKPGTYQIKETKAPEGYNLSETIYEFVVDEETKSIKFKGADYGHTTSWWEKIIDLIFGQFTATSSENNEWVQTDKKTGTLTIKDTPIVADVLVRKYWNDNDNQDGKRPGNSAEPTSTADPNLPTVTLKWTTSAHTAKGLNVYTDGGNSLNKIAYEELTTEEQAEYTKKYINKNDNSIIEAVVHEGLPAEEKENYEEIYIRPEKKYVLKNKVYHLVTKEDVEGKYSESASASVSYPVVETGDKCRSLKVYKDQDDKEYVVVDGSYHEVTQIDVEGTYEAGPAAAQPDVNALELVKDGGWKTARVINDKGETVDATEKVNYVGGPVLTHQNDAYTWNNLPAYRDGKLVTYMILEEGDILDNTTSVYAYDIEHNHTSQTHEKTFHLVDSNGSSLNQTVDVTNKHETQVINIEVYKTWKDVDKSDRKTAKLELKKVIDGIEYPVTITENGNTSEDIGVVPVEITIDPSTGLPEPIKVWKDLPTYEGGKEVSYRIIEEKIDGYITIIEAVYDTVSDSEDKDVRQKTDKILAEDIKRTFYEKGDTIPDGKKIGSEKTTARFEILNERSVNIKVYKTWRSGANASVTFELWRTIKTEDQLQESRLKSEPLDEDDDENRYYIHKIIIIEPSEHDRLPAEEADFYTESYVDANDNIITITQWQELGDSEQALYTKGYVNTNTQQFITEAQYSEITDPAEIALYEQAYHADNPPAGMNSIITPEEYAAIKTDLQDTYTRKYVDLTRRIITIDQYDALNSQEKAKYDVETMTSWSPYAGGGKKPSQYTNGTETITKDEYEAKGAEEKKDYKPVVVDGWEYVGSKIFDANDFDPLATGDKEEYVFNDLEITDNAGNVYLYRVFEKTELTRFRENQISNTEVVNNNVNASDGNVALEVVKELENRKWNPTPEIEDNFYFMLEPVKGIVYSDGSNPKDIAREKVPMPYRIDPSDGKTTFNETALADKDHQVGAIGRAATFLSIQYKEHSDLYYSIPRGSTVEFYYDVYEIYNIKTIENQADNTDTITVDQSLNEKTKGTGYLDGITYAGANAEPELITKDDYDNNRTQKGQNDYYQTIAYVNNTDASDVKTINEYEQLSDAEKENYDEATYYINKNDNSDRIDQTAYDELSKIGKTHYTKTYGYVKGDDVITEEEYSKKTSVEKEGYVKTDYYTYFAPVVHRAKVKVTNTDGIISTITEWEKNGDFETGAVPVYTNSYSSKGEAKAWIEKKIADRAWVDYDKDNKTGDVFSFRVESISGAKLNVPGAIEDSSYTSKPLMSNTVDNPQSDIQKMSDTEYAFGLTGNPYDNTMLNADGYAYFIYEISENGSVTYKDEKLGDGLDIKGYSVDGLEYDENKIYAKLKAQDNYDGTISFTVKYYSDATCKDGPGGNEITGHEVWIHDDGTQTTDGKKLVPVSQYEAIKAMDSTAREEAGYRKVSVAYFVNHQSDDIPVVKQWKDGPAIEDVTLHLERHLFPISGPNAIDEDEITDEYVLDKEKDWKPEDHNEELFWETAGYTHISRRGEFLNSDGTPKYDTGSDNISSNGYVNIAGFNKDLHQYIVKDGITYRVIYRLLEDDTSNTYEREYKTINIISDDEYSLLPNGKGKDCYDEKYVDNSDPNDIKIITVEEFEKLDASEKANYAKAYVNKNDSTDIIYQQSDYDILPASGKDSYAQKYVHKKNYSYASTETYNDLDAISKDSYTKKYVNKTDPSDIKTEEEYNKLSQTEKVNYRHAYSDSNDVEITEDRYNALPDIGRDSYSLQYVKETENDYIYTDGDVLVVVNEVKATNTANIAAVKQLLNRNWLEDDDFKFILTPIGKLDKDGKFVETEEIPMPVNLYVNKNKPYDAIDKEAYDKLTEKGQNDYEVSEYVNKNDSSVTKTVEQYEELTPEEKANYVPNKYKENSSTTEISADDYNKLDKYGQSSYELKDEYDEAHATSDVTVVDPNGNLERLARFGEIVFKTEDLVYHTTDKHYHGDFFYEMKEEIPSSAVAYDKTTGNKVDPEITFTEDNRNNYIWKDATTGFTYDSDIHNVYIKVKENRTDELQVQVVYDGYEIEVDSNTNTKKANIKDGTQFTPVFTNKYDAKKEYEIAINKYIMGRDWKVTDVFDFRMTAMSGAPFEDADKSKFHSRDTEHDSATYNDAQRDAYLEEDKAVHSARGAHVVRYKVTDSTKTDTIQTIVMPKIVFRLSELNKTVTKEQTQGDNPFKYSYGDPVLEGTAYDQFIYSFEETNEYLDKRGKSVGDLSIDKDTEYARVTVIDKHDGTLDIYTEIFEDRYCKVPRYVPDKPTTKATNPTFVNQLKRELSITKAWTDTATSDVVLRLQWGVFSKVNNKIEWFDVDEAEWLPAGIRNTQTIQKGAYGSDLTKTWRNLPAYANITIENGNVIQKGDDKDMNDLWVYYRIIEDNIDHVVTKYSTAPYVSGESYTNTKYKDKDDAPHTGEEKEIIGYYKVSNPEGNPAEQGWYEEYDDGKFDKTSDQNVEAGKEYYTANEVYVVNRVKQLYVTNWPVNVTGEANVGVVKQYIGKDWNKETFTFLIEPVKSMIGSETDTVAQGAKRKTGNYVKTEDGVTTVISKAEYDAITDQVEKAKYTEEEKVNVMPAYETNKNKAVAKKDSGTVSVNERAANFDPLTIKLTDLAVDTREKIIVNGVQKENPNFGKAVGTFYYKIKEDIPTGATEITEGTGTDAKTYYVKDDANGNKIKYTTDEHIVKIYAVDDGSGTIDITTSFDNRAHGQYVPVYTNYAMMPTPITGEKTWIGGELKKHQNGTVTLDENDKNIIKASDDSLGLKLMRKSDIEDNASEVSKDDAGRDLVIVWAKKVAATAEYQDGWKHKTTGVVITDDDYQYQLTPDEKENYERNTIPAVAEHYELQTGEDPAAEGTGKSGPYTYTIMAKDGSNYVDPILNVTDKDGNKYTYSINETATLDGYFKKIDGLNITNTKNFLVVEKKWNDNNNQDGYRPDNVVIELYRQVAGDDTQENVAQLTLSAANNWKDAFDNLPVGDSENTYIYTVQEVVEDGSNLDKYYNTQTGGKPTIDYDYDNMIATITNTYNPETVNVKVTKVWAGEIDDNGTPEDPSDDVYIVDPSETRSDVKLHLYGYYSTQASGVNPSQDNKNKLAYVSDTVYTISNSATGEELTVEWKNLPKKLNGTELTYVVYEDAIPGYRTSVTGSGTTFTVTNTYVGPVTTITASKHWDDNNNVDGERYDVVFELKYKIGNDPAAAVQTLMKKDDPTAKDTRTIAKDADESTTVKWENLPVTEVQADGSEKPILYYVVESNANENGYETIVEATGPGVFKAHNIRKQDTVDLNIKKVWNNDDPATRPEYVVTRLIVNGDEKETVILAEQNGWKHEYKGLPKNDTDGEIKYDVKEDPVKGYTTAYTKDVDTTSNKTTFTITNTGTADKVAVKVKKVWVGDENHTDLRKDVNVILRNDKDSSTKTGVIYTDFTSSGFDTTDHEGFHTWINLPAKINDEKATYSIEEVEVDKYISAIHLEVKGNDYYFTITNTYVDKEKVMLTFIDPLASEGSMIVKPTVEYENQAAAKAASKDPDVVPDVPERKGYDFVGWSSNYDPLSGFIMVATYKPTDMTLVSYVDPYAANPVIKSEYGKDPSEIVDPSTPGHSGLVFDKWVEAVDEAGNVIRVATYKCVCSDTGPCPVNPGYIPPRTGVQTSIASILAVISGIGVIISAKIKG